MAASIIATAKDVMTSVWSAHIRVPPVQTSADSANPANGHAARASSVRPVPSLSLSATSASPDSGSSGARPMRQRKKDLR